MHHCSQTLTVQNAREMEWFVNYFQPSWWKSILCLSGNQWGGEGAVMKEAQEVGLGEN